MKISQREARSLRKRVQELEKAENQRRYAWSREWPSGTHLGALSYNGSDVAAKVSTARRLGHAVVLTIDSDKSTLNMYALPLAVQP